MGEYKPPRLIASWRGWPVWTSTYSDNGNTAVVIGHVGGERYAVLSINTDQVMARGEFILNHDVPQDVADSLERAGVIMATGATADYGFLTNRPIYRILVDPEEA